MRAAVGNLGDAENVFPAVGAGRPFTPDERVNEKPPSDDAIPIGVHRRERPQELVGGFMGI